MTSVVYDLNSSSFPDLNEDLLLSPNLSSASLSDYLPSFDHQNATQYISSESTRLIVSEPNYSKPPSFSYSSSSSSFEFDQAAPKNKRSREELFAGNDYCRAGIEGSSSPPPPPPPAAKSWIPSKMRITQKMSETADKPLKYTLRFHPNNSNYNDNSSSSSSIRVCSDCNTTTTPLWRSGPKGPKSLCNACGIRQRKARRALAAAGSAAGMMGNSSSSMVGVETYSCAKSSTNKEKKLRAGHVTQYKKSPKISLKNFGFSLGNNNNGSYSVFPLADDVEQAAILLMELSCGLLHHAS